MVKPDAKAREIAERLREARQRVYTTAAEAARALGMKPVTVRAHESGQNGVGYRDLESYARTYGVSLGWILTGSGASEPDIHEHEGMGVPLEVYSTVEDGVWFASNSDGKPQRQPLNRSGQPQSEVYADPRFPAEMVLALRLVSSKSEGEYSGECTLFAVPHSEVSYREGDHVVLHMKQGAFSQLTLRCVVRSASGVLFKAVTSDDEPLKLQEQGGTVVQVAGVVIGAVLRRDVNLPSAEALRKPWRATE